jgi:hypothetical protein
MLDQVEAYEKMKKISKLQHQLQGPNIPVSLEVQTPEVPRNFLEVPRIAAGTQPQVNSSEVSGSGNSDL